MKIEDDCMKTIYRGSEEYPKSFEDLGDNAPTALYGLGNIELLQHSRKIAVIGSRDVSKEGYETAYQYAKLQAMQGNVIVSGLALGCDTAAHKGALDAGGLTIAIVGSGLDYCHPIENKKLMNEIIKKGGLILTEYELGLPATPYRLTARCRLQAALADEVYVAECRIKSGSMRTVKYAQQLGRPVRIARLIEDSTDIGFDSSKWIPLEEAREMVIYEISREYDRIHSVEIDGETGHYYPDRARMNPPEDSLGDVEIWVYNETNEEVNNYMVEPHFHVCKGQRKEKGVSSYEMDIEVKIRNIESLNIWRSVSGNTSWSGLDELYNVIKLWLNEKAYDADTTKKEAIRREWNRHNMSNRVAKDEL